jgi:hypothetical protein
VTDFEDLAARYLEAWNEDDPIRRRAAIETLWSSNGTYVDPLIAVRGHDEVAAAIGAARAQLSGLKLRLASPVDGHHNQCRFTWAAGPDGVDPIIVGFDVLVADGDGGIESVLGFLDKIPAG